MTVSNLQIQQSAGPYFPTFYFVVCHGTIDNEMKDKFSAKDIYFYSVFDPTLTIDIQLVVNYNSSTSECNKCNDNDII